MRLFLGHRYFLLLLLAVGYGCSTDSAAPESTTNTQPSDVAGDSSDVVDPPSDIANVVDDLPEVQSADSAKIETVEPEVDVSDLGPPTPDAPPTIAPPKTALNRWAPIIVDNVVVMVDSVGMTAELLGSLPFSITTWDATATPLSPVGINAGLMCWDVNQNGEFDADKEDYDGDGKGTADDCKMHPEGVSKGAPGVVLALNKDTGGCDVKCYTLTGVSVWNTTYEDTCAQPAIVGERLIVPLITKTAGTARLLDVADGKQRAQVSLPQKPVTGAVQISPKRYAVGLNVGISVIEILNINPPAMSLNDTIDTAPYTPTSIFTVGEARLGATVQAAGDKSKALGNKIQFWKHSPSLKALNYSIETPSPVWGIPSVGQMAGEWVIIAGGAGWLNAWSATDGTAKWSHTMDNNVVTAAVPGGDEMVYFTELPWVGSEDEAPGNLWRLLSYNPLTETQTELVAAKESGPSVRWMGAPLLLCDLAIVQIVPDALETSKRFVAKPCPGGILAGAWARPRGNNQNQGIVASDLQCDDGPTAIPCKSTQGCVVNLDCNDGNVCTIDSCVSGSCSYKYVPGCCNSDENCDDFNLCTVDTCGPEGQCVYKLSNQCCESSSECDDGYPCTDDQCEQGFCESTPNPLLEGCCEKNNQCDDGKFCTADLCTPQAQCENVQIFGCCTIDAECNDNSPCTDDACVDNSCKSEPVLNKEGCCMEDGDCDDGNICTNDFCGLDNACLFLPIEDCCLVAEECETQIECVIPSCQDNKCVFLPDTVSDGCCENDEDCADPALDPLCNVPVCVSNFCDIDTITDCDDGNDCTKDDCIKGECFYEPAVDPCDDELPCTVDTCVVDECVFTPDATIPGCCGVDTDCDDNNPCTLDKCDVKQGCSHDQIQGCCVTDADCDDGMAKTTDTCVKNVCQHALCQDVKFSIVKAPVDIIFVVDQSTSMTDEIPLVRDYLNNFAKWITDAGVDYRVILLASRKKGENAICIEPPLAGPNCKDSETFMQVDKQISSHDALEKIMENYPKISTFLRPNSTRHFMVITDDESELSAEKFTFFLDSKPGFEGFIFHSIVGLDTLSCATGAGLIYTSLSTQTGGLVVDLCSSGWIESYTQLGNSTASSNTSFVLEGNPIAGSISVKIDGKVAVEGQDWKYDAEVHRVVLLEPLPQSDVPVQICYSMLSDIIPEKPSDGTGGP